MAATGSGFRAGRVKIPFGLYNEINDIDSARVPILLPQSVYPHREPRTTCSRRRASSSTATSRSHPRARSTTALYGGTIFVDTLSLPPGSPYQCSSLNVPYVAGGRLIWETPLDGLRVGGSVQALRLDATPSHERDDRSCVEVPAVLGVASAEYSSR